MSTLITILQPTAINPIAYTYFSHLPLSWGRQNSKNFPAQGSANVSEIQKLGEGTRLRLAANDPRGTEDLVVAKEVLVLRRTEIHPAWS